MLFSIVSPVYKAEKIVDELVRRLTNELSEITDDYEIILVEDCSPDNSWQKIEENCKRDKRVKGLKLSRNFGQHHAITAGLDHCQGEWIVVMDCDLQDRPEEISNLYNEATKGYDIVFAKRVNRQDSFFKKLNSRLYYKVFNFLSGMKQDGSISNFGIYNKKVIEAVNGMREQMRAFLPMVSWVGFKKTAIDVTHDKRFEGKSSYSFAKLLDLSLKVSIAYSDKPLRLTVQLGFYVASIGFILGLYYIIKYLAGGIGVSGFTSIIVSIWFLSGIMIMVMGVLGLYIGKIFEGVKNRPIYIVNKTINMPQHDIQQLRANIYETI